jgi:histidinol-phosphate aminotransferase
MKFINKYLRNLAPYKVASHRIWEVSPTEQKAILKLDWNEATIPPTPLVEKRLSEFIQNRSAFQLYPSTHNKELTGLLSHYTNLPSENIQYFASSDSLHEYIVRMFVAPGDPILILGPTYDNFRLTCESQGARIFFFEFNEDFQIDLEQFESKINIVNPSLVYICNPNNPTGNTFKNEELLKLVKAHLNTLFLIDEAYFEFHGQTIAEEVRNFQNILITRTFSKAFALANFRAGYLLAHQENIAQISKIRNPKNISSFAQEAMVAALQDTEYMLNYVQEVNLAKQQFSLDVAQLSFVDKVLPSQGNFVLVIFENDKTKNQVFDFLATRDIFVRNLSHSALLQNALRITVGTRKQMESVLEALTAYKNEYR